LLTTFAYHLLPPNTAVLTLGNNDTALLDFLLQNKIIPLECRELIVKNKKYASLVEY